MLAIVFFADMADHSFNAESLLRQSLKCRVNLCLFAAADDYMCTFLAQPLGNRKTNAATHTHHHKHTVIITMLSGICMISTLLWILHRSAIFYGNLITYPNEMWSRDLDYSRQQLIELCNTRLTLRPASEVCHTIKSMKLCQTRGCRAGRRVRLRRRRMFTLTPGTPKDGLENDVIPVITGNRPWNGNPVTSHPHDRKANRCVQRQRVLVDVIKSSPRHSDATSGDAPSLYVFNAAAITKPHAVEHLTADMMGYKVDIAVITETHLKKKHSDHHFAIDGFVLFRRDCVGRRGGGVAVYVNSSLPADIWTHPADSAQFELLWVRVQAAAQMTFIGELYHPPKPQYQTAELLDYIEAGVDAVTAAYPSATIVLAGDFNTLNDTEVATRGALLSIVDRPTRGTNMLDRVYVNNPCYTPSESSTPR